MPVAAARDSGGDEHVRRASPRDATTAEYAHPSPAAGRICKLDGQADRCVKGRSAPHHHRDRARRLLRAHQLRRPRFGLAGVAAARARELVTSGTRRHADGHGEDEEDTEDPKEEAERLELISSARPPPDQDPRAAAQFSTRLAGRGGRHFQLLSEAPATDADTGSDGMVEQAERTSVSYASNARVHTRARVHQPPSKPSHPCIADSVWSPRASSGALGAPGRRWQDFSRHPPIPPRAARGGTGGAPGGLRCSGPLARTRRRHPRQPADSQGETRHARDPVVGALEISVAARSDRVRPPRGCVRLRPARIRPWSHRGVLRAAVRAVVTADVKVPRRVGEARATRSSAACSAAWWPWS